MDDVSDVSEETRAAAPSKHELIVDAALKLFLDAGYGATSMDAIANEAGVSKQTVYSHFHTKKALFAAVIGDMCRRMGGPGPEDPLPEGPPAQVLKTLGRLMLDAILTPNVADVFRVVLAESANFPELNEILWNAGHCRIKAYLSRYFAQLIRQDVLPIHDPDLAAEQFMGMLKFPHFLPALLGVGTPTTSAELDRHVDQAVAIFLGGPPPVRP